MKKIIIIFTVATVLFGCGNQERKRLLSEVDSLTYVIIQNRETEIALNEVGVMLDSIDDSRYLLNRNVVEGVSYASYIDRLKNINEHIKKTQLKIAALEADVKKSKRVSASNIKRLKAEVEEKSREILALQMTVITMREDNKRQYLSLVSKDSIISSREEIIRLKNKDVASLQSLVEDINAQNRIKVANMYFAQGQALETAADRTKFAPRKKKETRREALELYRLAYSMGNLQAQDKIINLEKELS